MKPTRSVKPIIVSLVDVSVLNTMRAWRRQHEKRGEEKLALLRRLRRQYETGSLPEYKETQVEQSFNEHIFARVFDYETLLSHDGKSRHQIEVKQHIGKSRRTPDFVVGTFAADKYNVIAAAELKSPDFCLDKPQSHDGYDGLSPVQQAFRSVRGETSCHWIIVCNYIEIRLYERVDLANDNDEPPAPIIVAQLPGIRDKNDLAKLCAHFDRRALLGRASALGGTSRSELMAAIDKYHPANPMNGQPDHLRVVLLFTPHVEEDFALFRIERHVQKALDKHCGALLNTNTSRPAIRFELADGYISATMKNAVGEDFCKVSLSGLGQLQVSVLQKLDNGAFTTEWLVGVAQFFVAMVDDVFHGLNETVRPGRVTPELREVKDKQLHVAPQHQAADSTIPSSGQAKTINVQGVDFLYTPALDKAAPLIADVVSELAIYFRSPGGSGVGINREALIRELG